MKRWRIMRIDGKNEPGDAFEPLREIGDVVAVPATREAVLEAIPDFDVVFAGLTILFDREMLDRARRLKVITQPATGRDHISLDIAAEKGITILSLKDETEFLGSITATAEMAWALLLATVRQLPWVFEAAKAGEWRGGGRYRGHQLSGKTLGILGYGRLGRITAQYGHGFRMKVIACDRKNIVPEPFVTMVEFDTLLREADVISIHIHLTEDNRRLIDRAAFDRMKTGAVLINTSRGGIVDEAAFIEALSNGKLLGAGVDVIDGEWDPDIGNHPLIRYSREHQNLIISPHLAGVTYESQDATRRFTVMRLKEHLMSRQDSMDGELSRR